MEVSFKNYVPLYLCPPVSKTMYPLCFELYKRLDSSFILSQNMIKFIEKNNSMYDIKYNEYS